MKLKNNPSLVATIRNLQQQGAQSVDLLRFLEQRRLSHAEMMSIFREAFDLEFDDVSCIAGWFGDGSGELSDEAVNRLLRSAIASRNKN
jgi:hypothetical protein